MQTEAPSASSGSSLWALLIGIDEYRDEYVAKYNLRGCVNDVEAMRIFLANQLGVPDDHIRVLTNQDATRTAILRAFQEFLIDNPAIATGDQIFFHFSGHGSQMRDPTGVEPDGYNETLVAYDSRTPGVYDIPDKTLAVLLDRLAAHKGDHITVILDCCHSGSGTRRIELPGMPRVRLAPADDRLPPLDLDADLLAGTPTRQAGPSGWAFQDFPYVLLASCRDRELSNEYRGRSEDQRESWYGALTYFALYNLRHMSPNTTYADLHERVAAQVNAVYRGQNPQCEGDRDRVIFGGMRIERDPFISVRQAEGTTVTLAAGLVHGLRLGTELALYPPGVRTRADVPEEPLATVEVVSVSATTARARLQSVPDHPLPLHARGVIIKHVYVGLRQTVSLQAAGDQESQQAIERLRQAIGQATPGGKPSPYLEMIDAPTRAVDLHVVAAEGKISIYGANGELLAVPEEIQPQGQRDAFLVLHALECIARYSTVQTLTNEDPSSQIMGRVKLRLRRYVTDQEGHHAEDLHSTAISAGGELTIAVDPDHEERNLYVVDVVNESTVPVYPHVFMLNPDYGIKRLYPLSGQEEVLKHGGTLSIGLGGNDRPLEFYLPDEWDTSRDILKAIVTTEPCELKIIEQDPLNVLPPSRGGSRSVSTPLEQLLEALLYQVGTRTMRLARSSGEDWATVELPVTSVRAIKTVALDVPAGRIPLGDGLTLVKPEGFSGQATVTTWDQSVRGVEGDFRLKPPPGLAHLPDLFQLVERPGTRSIGSAGFIITLEVDESSRQRIAPENPLRVELPGGFGEEVADVFPVAFDGEDYLLVGHWADEPNAVDIVSLPPPAVPTRGMRHAIRLFLYKKMGRYAPLIGLHHAQLENGQVVYRAIQRDQFEPGQQVALFIHGFTSDTRSMIEELAQFLRRDVQPYDHLLTWDYESFGTSVEEHGARLAQALRQQCGFGPNDGITIDVYAHSMGGLVARCMIEFSGGHQFVDRLIMAGTPNRGTTLATLSRGFVYLASASINFYLGPINWLAKQLYRQGAGLADLVVDSPVVERLNVLEEPSHVPYLALVGESTLNEQERSRLNRLAQKILNRTLDTLFGEPNDLVVGVSSMLGLRGGGYPSLTLRVLPCTHFHYFDGPQGKEVIKEWIASK